MFPWFSNLSVLESWKVGLGWKYNVQQQPLLFDMDNWIFSVLISSTVQTNVLVPFWTDCWSESFQNRKFGAMNAPAITYSSYSPWILFYTYVTVFVVSKVLSLTIFSFSSFSPPDLINLLAFDSQVSNLYLHSRLTPTIYPFQIWISSKLSPFYLCECLALHPLSGLPNY